MLHFVKNFDSGLKKERLPQWTAFQRDDGSPRGIKDNLLRPQGDGSIQFVLAELVLQSLTGDAENLGGLGAVAAGFLQGR